MRFLVEHRRLLGFGLLAAALSGFGQTFFVSLFSEPIREAFAENPDLHNMMLAPRFREVLNDAEFQHNWRRWVNVMVERGLPGDAIGTALNFFDTYRTARLPANMIQAQRDRFGEHGFQRVDREDGGYHLNPAD
ncbi:MAG: hypothetical protein ACOC0M_10090 [Halomonas sp.]